MERAYSWNCVGRCSQLHSDDDCEEFVVEMHIPPIKGTAQGTFKVAAGTAPTLSMPIQVANGHRLVYRGEDTMLSTAAGEICAVDTWRRRLVPEGADQQ